MRRILELCFARRLAVATTAVALAVGSAGLGQPNGGQPAGGGSLYSTHGPAITEAAALDTAVTERRTPQRSDLFLLAVLFAGVVWALQSREGTLADRGPGTVSFGRLLPVRDRGPPFVA